MKKTLLLLMVCNIILVCSCGSVTNSDVDFNYEQIDIDIEKYSSDNKQERYNNYLQSRIEEMFLNKENIESANAIVYCNEELDQYSLELFLESTDSISDEQIGVFVRDLGKILDKRFVEITMSINDIVVDIDEWFKTKRE